MTEARRQQWFTGAAIAFLLLTAAFDNAWLMAGTAVALLAVGFLALPRQRARGVVAAVAAGCIAVGVAMLIRRM
jgi:hypothetical protein